MIWLAPWMTNRRLGFVGPMWVGRLGENEGTLNPAKYRQSR